MREGGRRGTFADHQQSLAGSGYYWDYPSETGIGAVRVGPGGLRVLDSAVVSSRLGGQVHIEIVTPHESAASRRAPEAERAMGSGVWRFGPCELDLEGRELRKHGRRVRIAPQAFYTLTLLVQRAGELVTREELCRRLWPDGTHVDFEGNLNAIVRDVREALGDSARHSQFIETEPKCGYRFVAPASLSARAPAAGDIAVAALPLKPRRRTLLVKFALLAALVLFAIFVVYQLRLIEKASLPARITRLTNFLGSAEHPTFSPDGSRIAFEWNGDARGTFDIYIKTMGSDNLWRLTADPVDDESPAWSPDGRDIAFLRANSPGEAALMLMPVLGGPEQQITVVPTGSTFAWSADGRWIAYSSSLPDYVRATTDAERGIRAISLETGKTVQITSPSRDALGDISPAFSPDGRQLAFVRIFSVGAGDLYVLRIGRDLRPLSKPRRLTFDLRYIDSPAWLPGSREIVFTSERGSFASLWKVPVSEPSQVRLLGGEDAYDPAVDPKGGEIVYSQLSLVDSLNRLDLCGLGCTPAAPKRIFFSEKKARNPSYSPDGRRIAFESFRSGNCEIWICNRDGSNARQLTHFNGPLTGSPRWAPDGQSLAFDSRVAGRGKIFTMSAKGGTPRQLTFGSAEDVVPFWSPDGHWIYFASNRRGNFQIWKVPAGGGSPRQVTRNGGFYPEESPDGKTLYYVKSVMNPPIWRVPTSGGKESLILSPISDWQNYSVAHDGIFFVPGSGSAPAIQFLDFATGKSRQVASVGGLSIQGLSVSPDERSILFSKRESVGSDLMLMEPAK